METLKLLRGILLFAFVCGWGYIIAYIGGKATLGG
jgi:hypothetical protein